MDEVRGYRAGIIDGLLESALAEIRHTQADFPGGLQVPELAAFATVATLAGDARRLIAEPLR